MLADLSFPHVSYLVQDVRMADISLASLVYLPCLRQRVLPAYCTFASKDKKSKDLMHQSIPAAPSPPATAGHLPALSVPGVGHLQILHCPGAGHLPTPGPLVSY